MHSLFRHLSVFFLSLFFFIELIKDNILKTTVLLLKLRMKPDNARLEIINTDDFAYKFYDFESKLMMERSLLI